MVRVTILKRLAVVPVAGICLALGGGCGDNTQYEGAQQQTSENQSQARKNAYGTAGNPGNTKTKPSGAPTGEAAARGRGGH